MGNITFSKFEEEEARKTLKLLLKLFKEKRILKKRKIKFLNINGIAGINYFKD